MTRFSLRYPHFIVVACLMTVVVGITSLVRMPVDLFPEIKIPVVVVTAVRLVATSEIMIERSIKRWLRSHYPGWDADPYEIQDMAGERLVCIGLPLWPRHARDFPIDRIGQHGRDRVTACVGEVKKMPDGRLHASAGS